MTSRSEELDQAVEYTVVMSEDRVINSEWFPGYETIAEVVNEHIRKGWQVSGSLQVCRSSPGSNTSYYQAMTRSNAMRLVHTITK